MGTLANNGDPDKMPHIMRHFIWVFTVCQHKIDLQSKKHTIFGEVLTSDPSIYPMAHPDFVECSFMENSIGLKKG